MKHNLFERHPLPWIIDGESIIDSAGEVVLLAPMGDYLNSEMENLRDIVHIFNDLKKQQSITNCPDCLSGRDSFEPDWQCPDCRNKK